jgi:hypothetical protein
MIIRKLQVNGVDNLEEGPVHMNSSIDRCQDRLIWWIYSGSNNNSYVTI